MAEHINRYIEASGAGEETRKSFDRLVSKIPNLSRDSHEAAIQAKEILEKLGFSYSPNSYKIQDVLSTKSGNCLGMPLLIGSILAEFDFNPRYGLLVNPRDFVRESEDNFVERLNDEIRYDLPQLATHQSEFPIYRFAPLEHLVLNTNGSFLLETTSERHEAKGAEFTRLITFEQALSCLYKDRVIEEESKGETSKAEGLGDKGLELWPDNRQIYPLTATLAIARGDMEGFDRAVRRFQEIDGQDSLFHFTNFLLTEDVSQLDKALETYPAYAQARALKAESQAPKDIREARFQYALASHLYANSNVLSLRDFYVEHDKNLRVLFGAQEVKETLNSFVA